MHKTHFATLIAAIFFITSCTSVQTSSETTESTDTGNESIQELIKAGKTSTAEEMFQGIASNQSM